MTTKLLPRPCICGRVTSDVYTPDQCYVCWLAERHPHFRERWSLPNEKVEEWENDQRGWNVTPKHGCDYRGEEVRKINCGCSQAALVFKCNAPENESHECTQFKQTHEPLVPGCINCPWRKLPAAIRPRENPAVPDLSPLSDICLDAKIKPRWFHLINTEKLKPERININGSIMRHNGRLLMIYRNGWGSAEIRFAELDHNLEPISDRLVVMKRLRFRNSIASEDPRLFLRGGQLWMCCNGYGDHGDKKIVSMHAGQISEQGELLSSQWARYDRPREWEKNWQMFEFEGKLNAVYQPSPTQVVLSSADSGRTWSDAAEVPFSGVGNFGLLRGGAMPFWRNGEWYSFCHTIAHSHNPINGKSNRYYTVALYTFSDTPPFAPRRVLRFPLMLPCEGRADVNENRIVFVCGAFYEQGQWIISGGWQDKRIFAAAFDEDEIERYLEPV